MDAELARMRNHGVDAGLQKHLDRNGIDGLAEGTFERVVAFVIVVRVAGCPVVVFLVSFLLVAVIGIQLGAVANGGAVNDRFENGTDLTGGFHLVVLEILVIESADPCFNFAVSRVCGNHGRMQDLQIMLDGVDGRIFDAVFSFFGRVNQHGFLGVHDLPDFLVIKSLIFEAFVNRAVGDCVLQDFRFPVLGTVNAQAQASAGGVHGSALDENLQVKSHPGLYITGEAVDVYAPCGGYQLHWAWASGYTAAKDCIERQKIMRDTGENL